VAPVPEPVPAPAPPPRKRLLWWQAIVSALIGMFLAAIGSVIAQLIAMVLVILVTKRDDYLAVATWWPTVAIAVIGTGLVLSLLSVAPPLIARASLRESLGLRGAHPVAFLAAPIGVLSLSPLADAMMQLAKKIAPWATFDTLEQLRDTFQTAPLWLIAPIVAFFPGISEELFFRGMLQRGIDDGTRMRQTVAILVSGLVFAAFHLDPHHVTGVIPLGLYLAWVAARTQSTLVTIVAHTVNNGVAVIASRFVETDVGYGTEEEMPWYAVPIGLGITAITVLAIVWVTRKTKLRSGASV
jgi:membrane protease YdiL (CAAX protease family)